jgi:hypothetical protein
MSLAPGSESPATADVLISARLQKSDILTRILFEIWQSLALIRSVMMIAPKSGEDGGWRAWMEGWPL